MENNKRILDVRISLGSKFQLQQTILVVFEKICPPKKFFCSRIDKMNVTIESFILELVGPNLPKKDVFGRK